MVTDTKRTLIRMARLTVKGIGGIAAIACVLAPFTRWIGLMVFAGSFCLGLFCLFLWDLLDRFDDWEGE
jgi:hypothetical protein